MTCRLRLAGMLSGCSSTAILLHTTLYGKPHPWEVMSRSALTARLPSEPPSDSSYPHIKSKEIHVAIAAMNSARIKKVLAALEGNWQAEMEGYPHLSRRWPTATPTRCALRCCATWPRPSWSTPHLWAGRIRNWADLAPSTRADPAARPTRWPIAPAAPSMALRRLEIEESRHIASYGEQLQGPRRRGLHRHPRARHRGRERAPPRARFAAARPLHCASRRSQGRSQGRPRRDAGQAQSRAASSPVPGSATPSTA